MPHTLISSPILSHMLGRRTPRGFVPVPQSQMLLAAEQYHADMVLHAVDSRTFVCAPHVFDYFSKRLASRGISVICGERELSCNYPLNIAYNVLRVGNVAFGKFSHVDTAITTYYKQNGVKMVNVSQGYAACSACIVRENAIITADLGIAAAAMSNNIDVLTIRAGNIVLPGMDSGFIGGASFAGFRIKVACGLQDAGRRGREMNHKLAARPPLCTLHSALCIPSMTANSTHGTPRAGDEPQTSGTTTPVHYTLCTLHSSRVAEEEPRFFDETSHRRVTPTAPQIPAASASPNSLDLKPNPSVAFFGDVMTHPDGAAMVDFIKRHGAYATSLWRGPLLDIGGASFAGVRIQATG